MGSDQERQRNKEEVVTKKMSLNTYSKTLQMDKDIATKDSCYTNAHSPDYAKDILSEGADSGMLP